MNEYQEKLHSLNEQNRTELESLEKDRESLQSSQLSFTVDQALIGLIIGKQGSKVAALKKKYPGVQIQIEDGQSNSVVRLYGSDNLEKVREEIELVERSYEIVQTQVQYLSGPNYKNMTTFKDEAGLASLYLKASPGRDQAGNKYSIMRAVGNKEALESFELIYETHMSFYD